MTDRHPPAPHDDAPPTGGASASPDPDPAATPELRLDAVEPGETPPSSSQTSGVAHQPAPPSSGISWGFVVAILIVVVLIGGGAIAAGISYL